MKKNLKILDNIIILLLAMSIILFILYPFLKVFLSSFYFEKKLTLKGFEFLKNSKYLIINSLFVSIFVTAITVTISVCIGIFCYISNKILKKIILLIFMITTISPPFISALSYIKLFGRRGFITHDILNLSIDVYGSNGIILMQSISFVSLSALIIISSLDNIDKSQINSARSLGAKTNNIIIDILLPELSSSIKVVAILSFIRSIADFSTPLIIGGSFETLASKSYISFISSGDILNAGAMNFILCIPVLIVFLFYSKYSNIILKSNKGVGNTEINMKKNGFLYFIISVVSLLFITFLILQYFTIILSSFTDYNKGKMYFTLEHIKEISNYTDGVIVRSIVYSIIVALITSFLGMLLQYYIVIRNKKYLKNIDFIATMPYMLPGTFFGIGYILAFNKDPINITGTTLIVLLNMIFKQLPFSTKVFNVAMTNIDKNMILSAKDLGANEFYIFKDIIIKNSIQSFFVSMINNFNSTMTTIGSIIFLIYPSQKVLTLVMFDVINSGKYNIASVIALLIILICLSFSLMLVFINFIIKNRRKYVFKS